MHDYARGAQIGRHHGDLDHAGRLPRGRAHAARIPEHHRQSGLVGGLSMPGEAALDLVKRLIGYDTTSRNSNRELIAFAQDLLEAAGARVRLTHDATGTKANLFATIGPEANGGIVLSGHTDVVPVDGQDWSSSPFTA